MDLDTLREFTVLAERLNYAQAALDLNMSQSTLSRHMGALERDLGCSLFTHGTRTALTYEGQIVLEESGALFTVEQRMLRRIENAKRSVQGKIRLADYFFSRDIKNFMLAAARRYRRVYPGIAFEFVPVGSTASIEGLLASGQLDVGVLVHTGPMQPAFVEGADRVIPLWHERSRMGIYTNSSNLNPGEIENSEVTLGVLRRLPVVLPLRPEYANFRNDLTALCSAHGFEPSFRLIEMTSLENLALVDMSDCAQILLESDLRDPANPFTMDPACSSHLIHETCWGVPYLLLPNRKDDPLINSFADFLRELAEECEGPPEHPRAAR